MSHPDPPGHPEPSQRDVRYGRHRARHADAAPEVYPDDDVYRYGDGESARPLYAGDTPSPARGGRTGPAAAGGPGGPGAGRGTSVNWPAPSDWPDVVRPDGFRPTAPTGGSYWSPTPADPAGLRPGRYGQNGPANGGRGADSGGYGPTRADRGSAGADTGPTREVPLAAPPGAAGSTRTGAPPEAAASARTGEPPAAPGPIRPGTPAPPGAFAPPVPRRSRAGRNLPAAIGVGVGLAAIVLTALFLWRPAFVAVMGLAAGIGTWEMVRAVRGSGARPPLVPLLAGCAAMAGLAWYGGPEGLTVALVLTVVTVLIWHLGDGPAGYLRDVSAGTMIATYVPFLLSFAILLARPEDGEWRVLVTLAAVVLSDTGGYAVGVFLGRHKMAPSISPGKSWEGFAGSLAATAIGCALLLYFLFDVPWWHGAVLGVAVSAAAVVGDLAESMIKRDLGVKDMSNLLPGHGGLMDRLDSIVLAAPVAYLLLSVLAPVPG